MPRCLNLLSGEAEYRLTQLHAVALGDQRLETVSIHCHCVDADVDQKFHVARTADTDCMLRFRNRRNRAVKGRIDHVFLRLNAETRAEYTLGKGLVRNILLLHNLTLDRCRNRARLAANHNFADKVLFFCGRFLLLFRSRRSFRILFLKQDPGSYERNAAGNREQNRVEQRIVDGEITRETGHAVSRRAESHQRAEKRTDCAADHAGEEGLIEAHVDTEDCRLGNAERSGECRGYRDAFGLLTSRLDADREAGTELCEVCRTCNRHPGV